MLVKEKNTKQPSVFSRKASRHKGPEIQLSMNSIAIEARVITVTTTKTKTNRRETNHKTRHVQTLKHIIPQANCDKSVSRESETPCACIVYTFHNNSPEQYFLLHSLFGLCSPSFSLSGYIFVKNDSTMLCGWYL